MPALTRRYVVMALATEAPFDPADPDGAFVLKPWKDPAALRALRAYRDHCFPELQRDLDAWIRAVEAGPTVRGDVGRRNEPYAGTGARRTGAKARPAPSRRARTATRPAAKKAVAKPRAKKRRR
ncbi:MAG TPA: hypothetical protein VEA38_21140 [Terriglobales bacterium]|nr:hypothetical protein [Terriglobales bacterium]